MAFARWTTDGLGQFGRSNGWRKKYFNDWHNHVSHGHQCLLYREGHRRSEIDVRSLELVTARKTQWVQDRYYCNRAYCPHPISTN